MANIKQVAKLAGVSIKTVSRVVNNYPSVRDVTRNKVRDAIRELNYKPDMAARSMRTKKTGLIGMVTDHVTTTPYAVDMIKGAQEIAWKYHKNLFIINANCMPGNEEAILRSMEEHRVEGIICATMFHQKKIQLPELPESMNMVLLDCFSEDDTYVSIVPDDYQGGVTAAMEMLKRNHKRVAIVNIPRESVASQLRLEGFLNTYAEAGISVPEENSCYGMYKEGESEIDQTDKVIEKLFNCEYPPTALFCGNDNIAMLVYNCLKERNYKIPDDVSVLGFDNFEYICTYLRPQLSTIALPHYEMGKRAVQELMNYKEHHKKIKITCPFINRESLKSL